MLRTILILICYATGTVLSLKAVAYACSFFIWSEIFRPMDFARRFFEFKHAHIVAGVLLASILVCKWRRRWNFVATVICILTGWIFICAAFAQFKTVSWDMAIFAVKYTIPLVIISISLVDRFSQHLFLYTLAASVGIWAAQAGLHCIMGGRPDIGMSIPGGQMTDRNDFISGVVGTIPLLAFVGWNYVWRYQRAVRTAAKAMLVLSVAAIFFSLSRGGVLSSIALFAYFMFATGRFSKRLVLGTAGIVIVVFLLPGFVTERMQTIELSAEADQQSDGSAASRLNLVYVGVDMTLSHPVVGVGPGNFKHMAMAHGHWYAAEPHNIWLKCSGEYGIPMLCLFVFTILLLLKRLGRARKLAHQRGDRDSENMAIAISCAIVGFLAAQTFLSQFLSEWMWAVFGLGGAFLAREEYERGKTEREAQVRPTPAPVLAAPEQAG